MAIKASAPITLSCVVDVQAVYRYYLLQSSTLTAPAKPTTNPPGGSWADAEPAYTAGSTNSLYTVDLTLFSDGTFAYSAVSLSCSYEAAKAAYNKAAAAQEAVITVQSQVSALDQDVESITARVGETYTKGETDANIEASVSVAKDVIRNEVSEQYATGNQLNEVKSTVEQQSDQIEFKFTTATGKIQTVSDALASNQALLEEYIRFKGALIELGKVGNKFTAELDNERLAFLENSVQIAYISNNKLYITDAEVSEHLAMGKADRGYYDLYVRSNGHLTLKRRR